MVIKVLKIGYNVLKRFLDKIDNGEGNITLEITKEGLMSIYTNYPLTVKTVINRNAFLEYPDSYVRIDTDLANFKKALSKIGKSNDIVEITHNNEKLFFKVNNLVYGVKSQIVNTLDVEVKEEIDKGIETNSSVSPMAIYNNDKSLSGYELGLLIKKELFGEG